MSEHKLLVSVILPVYNGARFLKEALESIKNQTYEDFEIIVINDGSNDDSLEIVEQFPMPNLRVYSQMNRGLPATLNLGISLARGDLVARMDQDDLSEPDRLSMQVMYLNSHREIGVVGTGYKLIDTSGRIIGYRQPPRDPLHVERRLFVGNSLVHGSVMFRREVLEKFGGYSEDETLEDYHLWCRYIGSVKMGNVPQILYSYRYKVSTSMVNNNASVYSNERMKIRAALWKRRTPPLPWGEHQPLDRQLSTLNNIRRNLNETAKFPNYLLNRSELEYLLQTSLGIAELQMGYGYPRLAIEELLAATWVNLGSAKAIRQIVVMALMVFMRRR